MSSLRQRCMIALVAPLALLLARPATCAAAQQPATTLPIRAGGALLGVPRIREAAEERQVRVSLEEHRLYVVERGRVVWSARIGTGTGEVLEGAGRFWDFSTPPGRFRVHRKERDPVWILPDWYFVERDEPIPPLDSPQRRLEGALGAAALYLTEEIAIHGTDQPELLGDAISHGCIRMSNEDVLRLYEELEVGTPVIVYGPEPGA
jgi:lipoprotein-anchoring transpeptidase ErfK/SrfK